MVKQQSYFAYLVEEFSWNDSALQVLYYITHGRFFF